MRNVHDTWIEGIGWRPYPIQVPVVRPLVFTDDPFVNDDHVAIVWIGPSAHLPHKVKIHPPRQAVSHIPAEDLQYPQWREFYAFKVIHPDLGCAWAYHMEPEKAGLYRVIWKVWD